MRNIAIAFGMGLLSILSLASKSQAQSGPSDPQIVGIVLAADDIDINYGKIALSKSKNKDVREFAQLMVTDHSAVQKSVRDLASKLGVTAEDSDTSKALNNKSDEITATLKVLKGKEFDRFYIDNEVAYHKQVTDAVAAVLIPSAQNAELKAALEGAQPLFLGHLEHSKKAQDNVEKGKGAMAAKAY
jgi:putative membrane protein